MPKADPSQSLIEAASDQTGFSHPLQSMRGLAAMVVLLGHCFGTFVLTKDSPMRFIHATLNGEGAVVFFFVLSGFVLSLQWEKLRRLPHPIAVYSLRRITRLFPMLAVAATVGTIYCNEIHDRATLVIATEWYNSFYQKDIDGLHFLLALTSYSGRPAAPLWSLFVELIGSALVPVFIATASTVLRKWAVGAVLLVISFTLDRGFHFNFPVYLISFFVGASIAWWGKSFCFAFDRAPIALRHVLPILLIGIFLAERHLLPDGTTKPVFNLIELSCAAPLVALLYHGSWRPSFLNWQPIRALGDISYSLYLLHFPIMYLMVQLIVGSLHWSGAIPVPVLTWILCISTATVTLALSTFTFRYVEMPFIDFGRMVSVRWFRRATAAV